MAVTKLKDGRWICYYRIAGKVKKEYFGRGITGESKAINRNIELGLKRVKSPKMAGPLFWEVAREYFHHRNFQGHSRICVKSKLKKHINPYFGTMPAIRIDHNDVDRYIRHRRQAVKNATIRRELTIVQAILNWAVSRRPSLIPYNPIHKYKLPPNDCEVIQPPTQAEINAILKQASPHLTRAIFLSYYLGLRPGAVELLTLSWDNVNFETMTIRVSSAHKGGPVARDVPIHPEFLSTLTKWGLKDGYRGPLINYRGKTIKSIWHGWKLTLKRAGIKRRLRPYDLRHRFVTRALEEGADMKALSEVVGSRPETLMRHYQHVSKEIHRQVVGKIPPIGDTGYAQKLNIIDLSKHRKQSK